MIIIISFIFFLIDLDVDFRVVINVGMPKGKGYEILMWGPTFLHEHYVQIFINMW